MKKIIIILLFISIFSLILSPVLAEEEKTTGTKITNIKEKVQSTLERRSENISSKAAELVKKKAENKERVRNSVKVRWNVYDKLIIRSGQLLDKLQIRIDRAKAAGKNTTDSEVAMTDARAKLADAKLKMEGIRSLIGTNLDKNGFKEIQKNLQAIHKDLNIVKQDAAKIIRNLKSFNSERVSTKSAEKRSTSSTTRVVTERE